jgi:hypothetical protein
MQATLETSPMVESRQELRTALEVVQSQESQAPASESAAKAKPPLLNLLFLLTPNAEAITARAVACAGDRDWAGKQLISEAARQLEGLVHSSPEAYREINGDLQTADQLRMRAIERIGEQFAAVCELGEKLKTLASLRAQIRGDTERLKTARAQLDSATVLSVSVEVLTRLEAERKHLPSLIADCERRVTELKTEIRKQSEAGRIDLAAVVKALFDETQPGDQMRSFIHAGFMDLE